MTAPAFGWDKFVANVMPRIPFRRWGTPDDLAGIGVYFASRASSWHTGDVITIDGGYHSADLLLLRRLGASPVPGLEEPEGSIAERYREWARNQLVEAGARPVDVDQALSIPAVSKCLLTSAEKKLKNTVQAAVESVSKGTFKAGTVTYNAASTPAAIGLSPHHDKIGRSHV